MTGRPTVAIDLDGTLTSWEKGPSDQPNSIGEWLPGAKEALDFLLSAGFDIVIHTCRATWEAGGGYAGVRAFFDAEGYTEPRVVVWHDVGKPIAQWYIDDRAISFQNNWWQIIHAFEAMVQTKGT